MPAAPLRPAASPAKAVTSVASAWRVGMGAQTSGEGASLGSPEWYAVAVSLASSASGMSRSGVVRLGGP